MRSKGEMILKAAIIEDQSIISDNIKGLTKLFFEKKGKEIFLCQYFKGRELLGDLEEGRIYDFYLLDLNLPDMDGLELLEKIKKNFKNAEVIIISAYSERAISCIHSGIFDFIPKTAKMEKELDYTLERLINILDENKNRCYYIHRNKDMQKIFFDDIYYIEMIGRRAVFRCRNGEFSEYRPLKEVYQMLPEKDFVYVNSGQVVNLWRVLQTSAEYVLLDNGVSLSISRRKRKYFSYKILKYQEEKL